MPYASNSSTQGLTLRFRLMAWNAVVVIVTALVTLLGVRQGVRFTLIHELDQILMEDVAEIELALVNVDGATSSVQLQQQLDRKDAGHAKHKWFVQLVDTNDRILYKSEHAPPELSTLGSSARTPHTFERWRFFARKAGDVTVVVGSSLELINADVRRMDRLVAMAVGVVLLLAPLCGYWLAGNAIRPLRQMIATMAGLRPTQLEERLVIRGTGDELDRLSMTFNQLLDRIGQHLQDRRDFLANAAHELRTPLAAIRSSIEVALNKTRTAEEYEALLADVIEESSSLELLVNQLLLIAETEAEGLQVHSEIVRFDELVEKAIDMFDGVAEHREIRLSFDPLPEVAVQGNPQHLRQVIHNLLDNALKFTNANGVVHVALVIRDDQAVLTVRDTGVGVRPQDLQHLFERFYRGNRAGDTDEQPSGTGLGLSICHAILRSHSGTIQVESAHENGACFTVMLPLAKQVGTGANGSLRT